MLTCPNCGYKQPVGDKCEKCSSLFSYYSQSQLEKDTAPDRTGAAAFAAAAPAQSGSAERAEGFFVSWKTAYRIASGTALALLLVVIFLIFHKAAPPHVAVDAQAAARAAAKLSQAQAAAQQKQPYQVTLDSTELNSYLNSNLQLQNTPAKSATAPSAAGSSADGDGAPSPAPAPPPDAQSPAEPTIDDVQSAVKDVKVDMVGDLVKAYVVFDFHGKDMSLELDGHLSSANGYLQFDPVAGQLGSLPLPQSTLEAAVEKLMSSPENREKLRLPPGVNNLKVENGQVVVNYQ
jgi:hypothetical protein